MSIRPLRLPEDTEIAEYLISESFQYPDHTPWQISAVEREEVMRMLWFIRTFWKPIRLGRWVSERLRDTLLGYVWELEHQPVGMVVVDRIPKTETWQITLVCVLPHFRGRGIASQMLNGVMRLVKERDGKQMFTEVPGENIPARRLYERLGFETYDGIISYDYLHTTPPQAVELPDGFTVSRIGKFDWKSRYSLATRIMPDTINEYEPITPSDFRRSRLKYWLRYILLLSRGISETEFAVRRMLDDMIVARAGYAIRSRWGDISEMAVRVDPEFQDVLPFLMHFLVKRTQQRSRRRRIELTVPIWQPMIMEIAEEIGFEETASFYKMGLIL
jgi:ribosomal protein S18 acetylase RimI-like enzyme